MAVSKRLRYEILKRDNYTCRYCGAKAPDVPLHIDHVTPEALGGATVPENLATACEDCNSGKSSTSPSDELVADVNAKALAWKKAVQEAGLTFVRKLEQYDQLFEYFEEEWEYGYEVDGETVSLGALPPDWKTTIATFYERGLPIQLMDEAREIAAARRLADNKRFSYFCGICWNKLHEIEDMARTTLEDQKEVQDG